MNFSSEAANASKVLDPTDLDLELVRSDFPILQQKVNDHPLVYLDNGASSQKPRNVIQAISDYYSNDHSNIHRGVHTLSQRATHQYESAREKIASLINARSTNEIIFVRGTTEGINLVASSYGARNIGAGDEILVTEMEHHSNIVPWQILCEKTGAVLKVVPINEKGELILESFNALLNERTRFVAVTHVSNALGTINPVQELTAMAHEVGAIVLVDGAQSTPHMDVNMQDLDCDFFVFSGHKLYGPTGIGVLYGRESLLDAMPPWQGGGDMIKKVRFGGSEYNDLPYKFEAGTPNIAGVIGLGAAVEYLTNLGIQKIQNHEEKLLEYVTEKTMERPEIRIIGSASDKSAILSFTLNDIHPHDVGTILDHEGIAVRAGHHCAMPVMEHFGVPATVRASFAVYNTFSEVDILFGAIDKVKDLFG
ncbi:MAG: cysteine desulfurase CsdA [Acidiferrobacteraceae bacterium]|nr:cysteine desulfurase CsdA [Acidiferrobacteraceae bacterium]|tara:strand:+ start:7538 stop:8806 length:1269 start_codon:yes stop_codon:yes gene_type:complete